MDRYRLTRTALAGGSSLALVAGLAAGAGAVERAARSEDNREVQLVTVDDTDDRIRGTDLTRTNTLPTLTNTVRGTTDNGPTITTPTVTNTLPTVTNTLPSLTNTNTNAPDDRSRVRAVADMTRDGGDGWTRDFTRDLTDDRTRNNTR